MYPTVDRTGRQTAIDRLDRRQVATGWTGSWTGGRQAVAGWTGGTAVLRNTMFGHGDTPPKNFRLAWIRIATAHLLFQLPYHGLRVQSAYVHTIFPEGPGPCYITNAC